MGAAKSSFAEKGENRVNIDSSADSRLDLVDGEGISTASIQLYENPEDTSRTPNKIDKDFPIKEESNLRLTLPALGNETSEMDGDRAEELSKYAEEISPLTDHLFISGWRPAASLASLQAHKITRIVNCCASFAPNVFSDSLATPIRYLSLRLVDSKEEDILWFLPQVLHFIDEGARQQQNTLVHCEKGISRSCAFAIAYHMWRFRSSFQDSFCFVKSKRSICNPNAGFLCNLIEFQRFLCLDSVSPPPLLFRLARHSSFDTSTPVLKLAIDPSTRQVSLPSIGLLSSRGVFVVVPSRESTTRKIFIWKGSTLDNDDLVSIALDLARPFNPYLTSFEDTKVVCQGFECEEFLSCFVHSPQMLRTPAVDDDINGDLYTSSDQGIIQQGANSADTVDCSPLVISYNANDHISESEQGHTNDGKPRLYQASVAERTQGVVWSDLGVYDDDDFQSTSILLLRCGCDEEARSFLWFGAGSSSAFNIAEDVPEDAQFLSHWLAASLSHQDEIGAWLVTHKMSINVVREGEETDEFWALFNQGL